MKFFLGERFCKGKKLVCYLFFFAYFAYVIVFIYKIKKWLKYWILRHFIRNSILYIKIYFYPAPQTVSRIFGFLASSSIFSRILFTWTDTVAASET